MKRINHNGIVWIIVLIIAIASAFYSCEAFDNPPNLRITNAYHDGVLSLYEAAIDTSILIREKPMPFGEVEELSLDPALYYITLDVNEFEHPELSDRFMIVLISSQHTYCEIMLKD